MAPNGDIDTSIFDQATKCDSLFEKRLSSLPGDAKERARIIEEQYQRFSRWAGYLGVLAEPQVSLDNRLKSVPDIRDWVLDLLEILETNLKHGMYHKSVLAIRNEYPLPKPFRVLCSNVINVLYCSFEA